MERQTMITHIDSIAGTISDVHTDRLFYCFRMSAALHTTWGLSRESDTGDLQTSARQPWSIT